MEGWAPALGGVAWWHGPCSRGQGLTSLGHAATVWMPRSRLRASHTPLAAFTAGPLYPQERGQGETVFYHIPSEGNTPAKPWGPVPKESALRVGPEAACRLPFLQAPSYLLPFLQAPGPQTRSWGGVSHSGMPATARGGRDGLQFVFIVTKEHFPIYLSLYLYIYRT